MKIIDLKTNLMTIKSVDQNLKEADHILISIPPKRI